MRVFWRDQFLRDIVIRKPSNRIERQPFNRLIVLYIRIRKLSLWAGRQLKYASYFVAII